MVSTALSERDLVQMAEKLPAAPRLLVEVGEVLRDPQADAREIVALLRQDTSVVARLLNIANSAAYARAEPAGSIEEAVASIGFREVHRLVGAIAAAHMADLQLSHYGIDGRTLRANALFTAVTLEELAEATGEDPRACYTVGLLRSIGKIGLELFAGNDSGIVAFSASGERALDTWEQRIWGTTNCDVGEAILRHWRLPSETITAVKYHYHPERRHSPIIHLLVLAATAAQDRFFGLPGEEALLRVTMENFTKAGIDERSYLRACERAQRTFARLHSAVA